MCLNVTYTTVLQPSILSKPSGSAATPLAGIAFFRRYETQHRTTSGSASHAMIARLCTFRSLTSFLASERTSNDGAQGSLCGQWNHIRVGCCWGRNASRVTRHGLTVVKELLMHIDASVDVTSSIYQINLLTVDSKEYKRSAHLNHVLLTRNALLQLGPQPIEWKLLTPVIPSLPMNQPFIDLWTISSRTYFY